MTITIHVCSHGFNVCGITPRALTYAMAALASEIALATLGPVQFSEALALELRGAGHEVRIAVAGHVVLHHGCGAAYTPLEWDVRPATRNPSLTAEGVASWFETRECDCGSSLSLAGLTPVCVSRFNTIGDA